MNAPTIIINDAHEALLLADDALSVTDVAREIHWLVFMKGPNQSPKGES